MINKHSFSCQNTGLGTGLNSAPKTPGTQPPAHMQRLGAFVPVASVSSVLEAVSRRVGDFEASYTECPGVALHTTPSFPQDCIVYNNGGIPFLHCFHQSCRDARRAVNAMLYKAALAGRPAFARFNGPRATLARQQAYDAKCAEVEQERNSAKATLPNILSNYQWSEQAIIANSPCPIEPRVEDHWWQLLCLFEDNDVVWIGRDKYDSGRPNHCWRFKTPDRWFRARKLPGVFVCPNAFVPGVHKRTARNVLSRRFLVVESDVLARGEIGAVFQWIEHYLELPLRAVVDTGNRSLHGWFDYPRTDLLTKLRMWLPAFGCDPAMFAPNQPCRLPGAKRPETGQLQRLLYLA
jgi:hypothetical protein